MVGSKAEPKTHVHKDEHNSDKISDGINAEKHVDDKRSLRFTLIVAGAVILVIAAIILFSKYAAKNEEPSTITYNGYVFEKYEGDKWLTQQSIRGQTYNIPFYYNPTEVLDIPIDPSAVNKLRNLSYNPNNTVYVSIDPNETSKVVLAGVEYVRILGQAYNIYNMNVKSAFNTPISQESEYPIITCKNQSRNTIVIVQKVSNKNLVSVNGNCILIESANTNESVRVADAFAFKLLNIISLDT